MKLQHEQLHLIYLETKMQEWCIHVEEKLKSHYQRERELLIHFSCIDICAHQKVNTCLRTHNGSALYCNVLYFFNRPYHLKYIQIVLFKRYAYRNILNV